MAKRGPGRPRKAENQPTPTPAPAPAPEPAEESLADQMDVDQLERSQAEPISESTAQQAVAAPAKILRPSELQAMVLESVGGDAEAAAKVDQFRFRMERGLPNPLRRYRISGKRPTKDGPLEFPSVEVEAEDESEAIRKGLDAARVKLTERHRWNLRCVCLEE